MSYVSTEKLLLTVLFTEGEVKLHLGDNSTIFTEPEGNNCFSIQQRELIKKENGLNIKIKKQLFICIQV